MKPLTIDTAWKVIKHWQDRPATTREAASRIDEVQLAVKYREPGYTDPASGIIAFGNWNKISRWNKDKSEVIDDAPDRLAGALERLGVPSEWSDEWVMCDSCGGAFRVSADSYLWQQSGVIEESGATCAACINPTEHLAALEGNDRNCNTLESIDPEEYGYCRIDLDFENGLHEGQAGEPVKIGSLLRAAGFTRYLFNLDATGQFDIAFSVWLHKSQAKRGGMKRALQALQTGSTNADLSPAEACRRALADATPKMAALPDGPGVKYAKCKPDGTATVRLVSPEEFIRGIGK